MLVHLSKNKSGKFSFNPVSVNLLTELTKTAFALAVLLVVVGACWAGGCAAPLGQGARGGGRRSTGRRVLVWGMRLQSSAVSASVPILHAPLRSILHTTVHVRSHTAPGHWTAGAPHVPLHQVVHS